MHGEAELVRDCLGKRNLALRPRARLGAVEREDADQLIEDDDRRRERGARAESAQRLAAAE